MAARTLANGMLDPAPHSAQAKISDYGTDRNATTSRLLRLPPEVRQLIYRSIFAGLRCGYSYGNEGHFILRLKVTETLSVPFVCRQIYAEAALLPFSLLSFNFFVYSEDANQTLCKMLGGQRAAISVLELRITRVFDIPWEILTGLKVLGLRYWDERQMKWWDKHKVIFVAKTGRNGVVWELDDHCESMGCISRW